MAIMMFAMMLAAAPPPAPLTVSGPWTVEFADKVCAMARPYAARGGQTVLLIKAPLVGREYSIYVIRPGSGVKPEVWREAFIVKPGGAKIGPFPMQAYTSQANKRIVRFSVEPEKYKLTEDGATLSFDLGREGNYSFPVPSLPKALLTLEACSKSLRKAFGIDQQMLDRVTVEPKQIGFTFRTSDYPVDAARTGQQGDVAVLAFVESDGHVSECSVIESSAIASFDSTTCAVLKSRARFKPARDASGAAMRSPVYVRVRWRLPS